MSEREFFEASSDWQSLSAEERAFCIHLYKNGSKSAVEKYGDIDLIDAIGYGFLVKELSGNVFAGKRLNLFFDGPEAEPVKFGDTRKNSHYFLDVSAFDVIDYYMICKLIKIDDESGALKHAGKKILFPGVRSGNKSRRQDIIEARDTLNRWLEMYDEE